MSELNHLRQAAGGWVSKAMFGVENKDLAQELEEIHSLIQGGIKDYQEHNHPSAVNAIGRAEKRLEKLKNHDAWSENRSYYRCIYEGGDGSAYESGWYKSAGVSDSLEAIRVLKNKMYEESDMLSR